jgi:hypothetical protein
MLVAIIAMLRRLRLDWDDRRLAMLKFEAELLVKRLLPRIQRVAHAVIEHRSLAAAQVADRARISRR